MDGYIHHQFIIDNEWYGIISGGEKIDIVKLPEMESMKNKSKAKEIVLRACEKFKCMDENCTREKNTDTIIRHLIYCLNQWNRIDLVAY